MKDIFHGKDKFSRIKYSVNFLKIYIGLTTSIGVQFLIEIKSTAQDASEA